MKDRKSLVIEAFFLVWILCSTVPMFSAHQVAFPSQTRSLQMIPLNEPCVLPGWTDGKYHDYDVTREMLVGFNDKYGHLVSVFSLGKSVQMRDIWCIRITNENNTSHKFSCLYDGCIHGNEWEGAEACLYFAEFLLINFERNVTVRNLLNTSEVYIVPFVNPDARQKDNRFNQNGVDLNRNFDVHFGRFLGGSYPFGTLFGLIQIRYLYFPKVLLVTNSGPHPFSEPESCAMRDLQKQLRYRDFSFYLTLHTATHDFRCMSDKIIRSEYVLSARELAIFNYSKYWVQNHTEYEAYEDKGGFGFGSSTSYCFKECHVASFCLETYNDDPWFRHGRHTHLVHWMNTTLPIFLYLLVNIENFHNWDTPDIEPVLPAGVPPPPIQSAVVLQK